MKKTFIALFNGSCEISGKGYQRIKMNRSNKFHFDRDGFLVNDDNISFREAHSDWGRVTHFAIIIQSIKGDDLVMLKGKMIESPTIESGYIAVFEAGKLKIELDLV